MSIPQTIGKYQVQKSLGRGEFGEVYLAQHPTLPLFRAVKLFNAAGQGEEFLREAKLQAGLEHERIIRVLDVGLERDRPYLVMEYASGGGLDALLAGGPLEPLRAAALALDVAEALEHAHGSSVAHRDLKPSNILLDKESRAKVADFGLARLCRSENARQTRLAGTPSYMSPEQLKGEVSPAGDLWALGAVLFEMLAGRPPFEKPGEFETMQAIAGEEPPPLGQAAPGCPPELAQLVDSLLSKDPLARPDAAGVVQTLRGLLQGAEPLPAAPAGGTVAAGDWPALGGGPERSNSQDAMLSGELKPAWSVDLSSPVLAQPALCRGRVFAAALEGDLFCLDLLSGETLWQKKISGPLFLPPLAVGTAVVAAGGRGQVAALNAGDGSQAWSVNLGCALEAAPELRAEGLYLAPAEGGLLRLKPRDGSLDRQWELEGSPASAPLFMGGLVIWATARGRLSAWELESGECKWSFDLGAALESAPCLDSGRVYACTAKGGLHCLDALNGQVLWQRELGSPVCAAPALQGDRLAVAGLDGRLFCLQAENGSQIWRAGLDAPLSAPPALGGEHLALADRKARLRLLEAKSGRTLQTLRLSAPVQAAPLIWRSVVITADLAGRVSAFSSK